MACDPSQLYTLLGVAIALIVAAAALILAAAVLNNSFWLAGGSPVLMVAAGFSSAGAAATLKFASDSATSYFQCMGSPAACAGALSNFLVALAAIVVVLGIQSTACFVAAGVAWIPWAGQGPMYAILATLLLQIPLITSAIIFLDQLINCLQTPPSTGTSSSPLVQATPIIIGVIVAIVSVATVAYVRRKGHKKGPK